MRRCVVGQFEAGDVIGPPWPPLRHSAAQFPDDPAIFAFGLALRLWVVGQPEFFSRAVDACESFDESVFEFSTIVLLPCGRTTETPNVLPKMFCDGCCLLSSHWVETRVFGEDILDDEDMVAAMGDDG